MNNHFRADQSELETQPEKIKHLKQLLEEALGNGCEVRVILQIYSQAKALEAGSYSEASSLPTV
jgi:hypothetical protein